jgi:hypothetical protein
MKPVGPLPRIGAALGPLFCCIAGKASEAGS